MTKHIKYAMSALAGHLRLQAGDAEHQAVRQEFERLARQIDNGEYADTIAASFYALLDDARSKQATIKAQMAVEELVIAGDHVGTADAFLEKVIVIARNGPAT